MNECLASAFIRPSSTSQSGPPVPTSRRQHKGTAIDEELARAGSVIYALVRGTEDGVVTPLVRVNGLVEALSVDDSSLYWIESPGTIYYAPK